MSAWPIFIFGVFCGWSAAGLFLVAFTDWRKT